MKRSNFLQESYSYLQRSYQWYLQTPERALDEAYRAASLIKAMEDEYFSGKKITLDTNYGDNTMVYFQAELEKCLKTIQTRLTEFNLSQVFVGSSNQTITKTPRANALSFSNDSYSTGTRRSSSSILNKLRFIDDVLSRYKSNKKSNLPSSSSSPQQGLVEADSTNPLEPSKASDKQLDKENTLTEETSVLPRTFVNAINQFETKLKARSEQKVIKNFRNSQMKTITAFRILLLLIIVPLLSYQLSKTFLAAPIITHLGSFTNEKITFLNIDMKKEALEELRIFEDDLHFQYLISEGPKSSLESTEEQIKEKAQEIAEKFRKVSASAVENIFADLISLASFGLFIYISKREIAILKSFIDDIAYSLTDSAKAFIIILFTDMFVGFHSPHGWEVLITNTLKHFGIPENQNFINLFIATFPVILDTVFKYWIFQYLSRISPSAVATYRSMDE